MCPESNHVGPSSNGPSHLPHKQDKGKAPMVEDKEGFIPIKTQNKGRGHKRTLKDRQTDEVFNILML